MKNTNKDRFEKKLIRFIKEVDKKWDKYGREIFTYDLYMQHRDELYKKYGFTDEEWFKACRLVRSWSTSNPHKTKRYDRKKEIHENKQRFVTEMKSGKQEYFDKSGEECIKDEDDWLMDISDYGLAYDAFLELKEKGEC
jgi:hypothetical protein